MVGSVRAASSSVAQAGLAEGKRVVLHQRHGRDFLESYPNVDITNREIFVEDGRVFTSPGSSASIDLAIELLSRHLSRARALKGLTEMSVDQHRSSFHMPRTPGDDLEICGDWMVEAAVQLMRERLPNSTTIAAVADTIGISVSQLNRLFMRHAKLPPLASWINLCLDHARWHLLNTRKAITQIAFECGFSDAAHFSRRFKQRFEKSPRAFKASIIPDEQSKFDSSTYWRNR